jgi:hypothetical protein
MNEDYHEQERIEKELLDYIRILNKSKEKQIKELSKESRIPKPVALSSLKSPLSNKTTIELSQDELDSKVRNLADLIIKYGREIL